MVSLSQIDLLIILLFFISVLLTGFLSGRRTGSTGDEYLLSGRKLGLVLFIMINVSTWYGGILGVGEFTYRFGLVSWFTQGFPYYVFAFLFAIFFAKKIQAASLFTVPDKLEQVYGKHVGLISAFIVFVLVSPAPYILMSANLISLIFNINIFSSLIISLLVSLIYLIRGGFRSNIYVDAFQFFVMFGGFILVLIFSGLKFGTIDFLVESVPKNHLNITGGMSPAFIIVWFLIALWTFADPGFHQRCYAAKSGTIAMKGIIISIFFWALFDFLTTFTGLYTKAILPELKNPVLAFPLYAEKVLPAGIKGIFYSALFATILSTQISFLFLSGTTIGKDFIFRIKKNNPDSSIKYFTIIGMIFSGLLAILLATLIPSVIEIWYTIGSFFIPGIIIPVISAYYPGLRINNKTVLFEMITAFLGSAGWYFLRIKFESVDLINAVEPMLIGIIFSLIIHSAGLISKFSFFNNGNQNRKT